MGPKPLIAFPPSTRMAAKVLGVGALFTLLASCISDGPNHTGGAYLDKHNILLQNPLYHVVIPDFPVDSVWTRVADSSHLGSSFLMAGLSGQFSAQLRLGYDVVDTNNLKNLADTTHSVKLSLRTYRSLAGLQILRALVGDDSLSSGEKLKVRDSLSFVVETWAFKDSDATGKALTPEQRTVFVNLANHRFLSRLDTNALLDTVTLRDTITLKIRNSYNGDSLQARALPNLTKLLRGSAYTAKWLIHFQLTPLGAASDSAAMLRLEGGTGTTNGPVLLFGNPTNAATATNDQKLNPVAVGTKYGVNYILRYGGSPLSILPAKNREMHMVLSRQTLIERINAGLKATYNIDPPSGDTSGNFDLTYFVPFGQISLPLSDSLSLEGNLPVELRLISDVDSLLPNTPVPAGLLPVSLVPLNESLLLMVTTDPNNGDVVLDSLTVAYGKANATDSLLRRVILKFAKDTTHNDTTYLHVGETKDIVPNIRGNIKESLFLTVTAGAATLEVVNFLNAHGVVEPNDLRDRTTGKTLTSLSDRVPRLLRPGQDSVALRATRGLQRLLNRTDADKDIFPDFVLQAISAVDTLVNTGTSIEPLRVPFPVLSVIPPKLNAGKLTVRLDLYLYPLKKER